MNIYVHGIVLLAYVAKLSVISWYLSNNWLLSPAVWRLIQISKSWSKTVKMKIIYFIKYIIIIITSEFQTSQLLCRFCLETVEISIVGALIFARKYTHEHTHSPNDAIHLVSKKVPVIISVLSKIQFSQIFEQQLKFKKLSKCRPGHL